MTAANFAIIPAIANRISDKRKLMDAKIWIAAAIGLLIILGVIAYNMYQENQYRRQVREQFGHADKDALLESQTESVRDGKTHGVAAPQGKQGKPLVVVRQADVSREDAPPAATAKAQVKAGNSRPAPAKEKPAQTAPADLFSEPDQAETAQNEAAKPLSFAEIREQEKKPAREKAVLVMEQFLAEHDSGKKNTDTKAETKESVLQEAGSADGNYTFASVAAPEYTQEKNTAKGKLLMDLDDMVKQELPWFEPRFDYMAYISLSEPQEFRSLPRFSGRHRFQIAGCTMDGVWQTVEPVPNIYYQGFIVALQAISRKGLATVQELEAFGSQVNEFAAKLDAGMKLMDIPTFLETARPLDELCERVDQSIAMHLISRTSVSGTELRAAVERAGFELSHDGAFHLDNGNGRPLFSIVTMDGSAFTAALLSSQPYKGFSILFDIPHVPAGSKNFDRFMDLTVRFSSELGLDLVNDKLEELSMEWLKDVGRYVNARQEEMRKVGIEPGGELAQRLFS